MGFKSSRSATKKAAAPKAAPKKSSKKASAPKARGRSAAKAAAAPAATGAPDIEPLRETIRRAIVGALERSHSLREAARALDMPYSSLRDKLYQLGIDVPERSNSRQRAQDVLTVGKPKSSGKAAPKKRSSKKKAPAKKSAAKRKASSRRKKK